MIDHNRDGLIDESDLREMLTLLGWYCIKILKHGSVKVQYERA